MIFKNQDEKLKNRSKIDEADSFWNVDGITPPVRSKTTREPDFDSQPVTVVDDSRYGGASIGESIKGNGYYSEVLFGYTPDNPLIHSVEICSWPSRYSFYEGFRNDAERFFYESGEKTAHAKYFSYMPTYAQMDRKQRAWYFYWRDCVRHGEYIETDSSYILLYIYEIINLPNLVPPESGLELLCDIWEKYRKSYTKLDKFLSEWVCDYCLINKLTPPYDRIAAFYDEAEYAARLKQFYIRCESGDGYAELLMAKLNSYRWQAGKYVTADNKKIFEEHIKKGFAYAVKALRPSDGRFDGDSGRLVEKKTIRDSFSGALCAYASKRKINVTYLDIDNRGDFGFIITDMVRYCENKVRIYLGIKGRLTVQNLNEEHKRAIDAYFDRHLPCDYSERVYKKSPEDEELYYIREEKKKPFSVSFERAKAIESDSWRITDRLTDDMYEEELDSRSGEPDLVEVKKVNTPESSTLDVAREGLIRVAKGDVEGFKKIADECFMLVDTLAECVNELCYEIIGDIGIEETEGGYRLISDYEQEIKQWLNL